MENNALKTRLTKEAIFQDKRVSNGSSGIVEVRSKFYYLAANAKKAYQEKLFDKTYKDEKVVVVGCSTGGVTPIARLGANVIGVDISPVAIKTLKKAIKDEGLSHKADAKVMNAEQLDFSPKSIDLICCSGVLHHLQINKALGNWSTVLKPTGKVLMIEPMAFNPLIATFRFLTPKMRTEDEHPLTPNDIRRFKNYFLDVKIQGFVLFSIFSLACSLLPFGRKLKDRLYTILEEMDSTMIKLFPVLKYFCWTCVIELGKPRKNHSPNPDIS